MMDDPEDDKPVDPEAPAADDSTPNAPADAPANGGTGAQEEAQLVFLRATNVHLIIGGSIKRMTLNKLFKLRLSKNKMLFCFLQVGNQFTVFKFEIEILKENNIKEFVKKKDEIINATI